MDLRGAVGFSFYKKKGGSLFDRFLRLLAKVIRFFTKSRWSHTFCIFIDDEVLGPYAIEAEELGVTIDSCNKYSDPQVYNCELWMPKAKEGGINRGLLRVARLNGKSYGYFQLLGFIWVWLVRKVLLRKVNNPITGGIICSELVLDYLKSVFPDEEIIQKMDKNTTSPEDIYELIKARPDLFEKIEVKEPGVAA